MALDTVRLLELVNQLSSDDAAARGKSADAVADLTGDFSIFQVHLLGAVLCTTASAETELAHRERQLRALRRLADTGHIIGPTLKMLNELDTANLSPAEHEYVAYFRAEYAFENFPSTP